ncbi:aspartate-semialdehyde dehydrogenase [Eubacteriales bacterium OttesenSCG-928-N13]|nr:aspartate-semialdehyde dehydrogenase [Eubacteriales bacterium OttesenSCG-928-N13]
MKKYSVAIIGATGMVGQRFLTLLNEHPWFDVCTLAASGRSAGKTYEQAVAGRWAFDWPIPEKYRNMMVLDASADIDKVVEGADFAFCAVDMPKEETRALEDLYATRELPIVSANSAQRLTPDVPMVVPEINAAHTAVIEQQRKRLGTKFGFVAVKPNCSIQGYVPALTPLREFGISKVSVCTYQAISGAGKTFKTWPEMVDNVIPYIGGEELKSEIEPLKIWGDIVNGQIVPAKAPIISAQCYRVAAADGHMAAVSVQFDKKPPIDEILARWDAFEGIPQQAKLPSAPAKFLTYFAEDNRPQTKLDRELYNGMGVSIGRLREDPLFDYKFTSLSHNTIRGAAGGAVLTAELLAHQGYIVHK